MSRRFERDGGFLWVEFVFIGNKIIFVVLKFAIIIIYINHMYKFAFTILFVAFYSNFSYSQCLTQDNLYKWAKPLFIEIDKANAFKGIPFGSSLGFVENKLKPKTQISSWPNCIGDDCYITNKSYLEYAGTKFSLGYCSFDYEGRFIGVRLVIKEGDLRSHFTKLKRKLINEFGENRCEQNWDENGRVLNSFDKAKSSAYTWCGNNVTITLRYSTDEVTLAVQNEDMSLKRGNQWIQNPGGGIKEY